MSNPVVVKLPLNATTNDIDEIFAYHEYGDDFVRALNLAPEIGDEDLELNEWLPLTLIHNQDSVTLNYRVIFDGKDPPSWSYVDRQVEGTRSNDVLIFSAFGRDA